MQTCYINPADMQPDLLFGYPSRMTEVWTEAMESSRFYLKADLKSIIISKDILMCHTAAVWKEVVGLLWPKENQQ